MNKKRTVVLHIGMPKTGTTSIQKTLYNNREFLLNNYDIYYPKYINFNHWLKFGICFLNDEGAKKFIERRSINISNITELNEYARKLKELWIKEFMESDSKYFVIVSEDLISRYSFEEIYEMKQFLLNYFDEIQIVMYVRNFESYFRSQTQQFLKIYYMDLDQIKERILEVYNFQKNIQNYIDVFGIDKIFIKLFNKDKFYNGSLVQDFLKTITDHDFSILNEERENESIGQFATSLIYAYRQKYLHTKNPRYSNFLFNSYLYTSDYDIKCNFDIVLNQDETTRVNKNIDFINDLLPNENQLSHVTSSNLSTNSLFDYGQISNEFIIDLINKFELVMKKVSHNNIERYPTILNILRNLCFNTLNKYEPNQKLIDLLGIDFLIELLVEYNHACIFLESQNKLQTG